MTLTRAALCIISGMLPLLVLPALPDVTVLIGIVFSALLLVLSRKPGTYYFAIILISFAWAVWNGQDLLSITTQLNEKSVTVETRIVHVESAQQRITLQLMALHGRIIFPPIYARVSVKQNINWCAGQQAVVNLRLRPVHAQLNEGGFDGQRFALSLRTPFNGRLLSVKSISSSCSFRQRVIAYAKPRYQMLSQSALLSALAFGDRDALSKTTRQLLRDTGTAHLMAISGMHIGLAAVFGAMLARLMQIGLPASRINYYGPLFCAWITAMIYCCLSGAQPPAQRAIIALSLWLILRLKGFHATQWQVWIFCIATILLIDPLTVLSDSFWLSVLAVATLFLGYRFFPLPNRFMQKRRWMLLRLLHLQAIMTLLFMPIQILIFSGISLTSIVANLWAVPLVSMITVPLILLALLIPITYISAFFWKAANLSLVWVVEPLSALPAGWFPVSHFWLTILLVVAIGAFSLRYYLWQEAPCFLVVLIFILYLSRIAAPIPLWRLDMLDIGHGLAMVISRERHAVLYDAGGRWPGGDAGERVIIPWLYWQGITPDLLILSHRHLDHIGGAESVLKHWPQLTVYSNFRNDTKGCHQGLSWQWQGLIFEVLWPPPGLREGGNDDSCVVLIDDGKHRVLLTGDIERAVEQQLVAKWGQRGAITLIQVPHHGSATSSIAPFLRRIQGAYALASAARYSPWKLPALRVKLRYQNYLYRWHDTAQSGQLRVDFFSDKVQVRGLREQILPRWYHQWFGVPLDSR